MNCLYGHFSFRMIFPSVAIYQYYTFMTTIFHAFKTLDLQQTSHTCIYKTIPYIELRTSTNYASLPSCEYIYRIRVVAHSVDYILLKEVGLRPFVEDIVVIKLVYSKPYLCPTLKCCKILCLCIKCNQKNSSMM